MTDSVRLSFKVPQEVADTLKDMAADRSTSITQIVRDAVWLERFLQDAKQRGERLVLVGDDGTQREVILR